MPLVERAPAKINLCLQAAQRLAEACDIGSVLPSVVQIST